jgi:Dolichyl-phosphate-mannose-protein mannosyltransferase
LHATKQKVVSEWDYKLALAIITALSFATRFLGISHPDEVVFDEVHFGKVRTKEQEIRKRALELTSLTVRFLLSAKNLLFRCSPSLRQATLCLCRLVSRVQW